MTSYLFVELDLTGEGYSMLFGHIPQYGEEKMKWENFQDELDNKTRHQYFRPLLRSSLELYFARWQK